MNMAPRGDGSSTKSGVAQMLDRIVEDRVHKDRDRFIESIKGVPPRYMRKFSILICENSAFLYATCLPLNFPLAPPDRLPNLLTACSI